MFGLIENDSNPFAAFACLPFPCVCKVFIKDVWKEYTGWPLNDMERQYKFMVKHVQLWSLAFHSTSPKWIHSVYLAAIAAFYAK